MGVGNNFEKPNDLNKKLDKLIDKHSSEFNPIIEKINAYIELSNSDIDYSTDDNWKIAIDCVNGLSKLAEYSFEYGNFKDNWEYDKFYQNLYGPELIIKSLKTNCDYRIGLDLNGIYLSTNLRFNDNLRYMDDQFWKSLMELSEFSGFEYEEYEFTSDKQRKKFPDLFKTNKSMIFRIMRKHFFDITNEDWQYSSSSVGEFKITWTKEKEFEFMVRKCCEAFKKMYRLNYQLWKVTDLKNKKAVAKNV